MQQIHHTTITAYKKVVENARNEVAVLQAMSDDEFERFADSQMHNPEQSGMEKLNWLNDKNIHHTYVYTYKLKRIIYV